MSNRLSTLPAKLLVAIAVPALVVLGLIGLVLPVIPGLVLLALAALVVARTVPSVDARLRRHRALGRHMHRVDRFFALGFVDQLRVAGLVTLKAVLEGLGRAAAWLGKHLSGSHVR